MEENLKDMLIPEMNRANKVVQMVMEQRMHASEHDLTIKQFILLHRVNQLERPQHELAMITNRDKGSLTRLIQSLERKDYVKRRISDVDCRINLVTITGKGQKVLLKASKVVRQAFKDITIDLSDREQKAFIKICKKLNARASEILDGQANTKSK